MPIHGTWQQTGGGSWRPIAIVAAAVVVASSLASILAALAAVLWAIFAILALLIVSAVAGGVWLIRRNMAQTAEVTPWRPAQPLPHPERPQVTSRPAEAIHGPRELHVHLHGPDAASQLDAIRRAGYQAWDQRN
jgi:hypothetical protein